MPTISIVEKFREDFEAHLNGKPCPYEHARTGFRMRNRSLILLVYLVPRFKNNEDLVHLTIDGKPVTAAPGTLVINAAKQVGIEIPSFCYYEGLTSAGRLPHVPGGSGEDAQAAGGLHAAGGRRHGGPHRIRRTVHEARKGTLEFLLTNHPLDCPVCDKGGECELQDMVFRYGVGESRFLEQKLHVDEQQWSPVVFYDAPRCILCYRCVRICDEGMGVNALGVINRGAHVGDRAEPFRSPGVRRVRHVHRHLSRWARSPAARIAIRRGPGK